MTRTFLVPIDFPDGTLPDAILSEAQDIEDTLINQGFACGEVKPWAGERLAPLAFQSPFSEPSL